MIAQIVEAVILVLTIAIIARALLSWFPNLDARNPLVGLLYQVTEPILAPIRSIMPRMGIDFSPIIAIFLLQIIGQAILSQL